MGEAQDILFLENWIAKTNEERNLGLQAGVFCDVFADSSAKAEEKHEKNGQGLT